MPTSSGLMVQRFRDVTVVSFNDSSILDVPQIQTIADSLYELVDKQACQKLVLDFSSVQFLSSSMLGVLINLKKKSQAIKGCVSLCGVRPDLMKLFSITNLEKLFDFHDTEEAALRSHGVTVPT